MKITKKLIASGLMAVLAIGMVGCAGEAKSNTAPTSSPQATEEPTTSPESTEETTSEPPELTEEEKADPTKVVIATVNGAKITQGELDEFFESVLATYEMYYGDMGDSMNSQKPGLIQSLIDREIIIQQSSSLGVECTDEEVDSLYAEVATVYGEEEVKKMIEEMGYTVEQYKQEVIKESKILSQTEQKMQEGEINITEADIKSFYESNKDAFKISAGGNMEHILVKHNEKSTEEDNKKAQEAVKQIEEEFASGKTFEELKEKYTKDDIDSTLYAVENLGFVPYEHPNFDKLFLAGAKEVKEGEVSGAVVSSFGTHFIKVQGIREESVASIEDVKDTIKLQLEQAKREEYYKSKLEEWKKDAEIEVFEDRIK